MQKKPSAIAQNKRMAERKKILLIALENHLGVVTPSCVDSGINRQEHYQWIHDDPEYAADVRALKDVSIDFAESAIHKQISEGSVPSTIFYLKTMGKSRGYVERQEIDIEGDLSLQVQFVE